MSSHLDFVAQRVLGLCALENCGLDAVTKSLRAYTTRVHPLFMERLQHHYNQLSLLPFKQGKTFNYQWPPDEHMSGSQVMNYLFQSFYDQEQRSGEEHIIYCKMSVRTLWIDVQSSMLDCCKQWIQSHYRDGRQYASLRDLAEDQLGPNIFDVLDNYASSPLSESIIDFIDGNGMQFPSSRRVRVNGRVEDSKLLRMSVKYYESRDDNRAYCIDQDRLRALVGSLLHRLILPKAKHMRYRLQTSRILRTDEKDMLSLDACRATSEHQVTLLIIGDISNFTGSLANAWLMLHCMCLDASQGPLRKKRNLFSINGANVSAAWHEILALYIYLTVGIPAWIEDREAHASLPGGFLGVNANITSGLLFLCLAMEYVLRSLKNLVYSIQAQAGGDDHAFLVTCDRRDAETISCVIRYQMTTYVGHLKEFEIVDLTDMDDGIIPDVTFCRKRLRLSHSYSSTHVRAEPTLPIPVAVLPTVFVPPKARQESWSDLDQAFRVYEETYGDTHGLCDAFRSAYLARYPNVRPIWRRSTKIWLNRVDLVKYSGRLMTQNCLDIINSISVIYDRLHNALNSSESRVRHALASQMVEPQTVEVSGAMIEILIASSDTLSVLCLKTYEDIWRMPSYNEGTIKHLHLK